MAIDENRSPADATEALLGHYKWERGVAAHRLPGSNVGLPAAPLDDQQWQVLLEGVRRHWIWGLLDAAVMDGVLPCTTRQAKDARTRALHAALADLAVEARLVSTSDLLREGGIEHRVLKGVTTAARVYSQRKLRSYGDVDVLVTGTSFDTAVRLLEQSGGKRRYAEARPGFDHRFSKGASFWMPDGISIDLHRTFVLGPFGFTVDLGGIFSRSDVVTVGGREITCMEIIDAAVHACMHAGLGDWPPRLVPMRDVVHFLTDERVDPDALRDRAGEWRCQAVVARAVLLAQSVYGFDDLPLSRWASGYRPRRWERRTITLYGEGHTYRRQAIAAARFVPGGREKVAYVKALTFPASTYLRDREGSVLRRALRAVGVAAAFAHPPANRRAEAYLRSRRVVYAALTLVRAGFDGLWLGLLDREHCEIVDRRYYDGQPSYVDAAYNQRGLWPWERDDIDAHFRQCRRIAVLGAGGGREVVALRRMGFEADGYECNDRLLTAGNELLEQLGLPPTIFPMPRDRWPEAAGSYDGVIIGWGTYMLIQGRSDRVDLLRSARAHMPEQGPVLVSFFVRQADSQYFRTSSTLANAVRRIRRREPVDVGASLAPNRVQFLTIAEVEEELRLAGFELARHGTDEYGHAVGLAVPPSRPT